MMLPNTVATLKPRLDTAFADASSGYSLTDSEAWALVGADEDTLAAMCEAAAGMRDMGKGRTVSFSPKVFIPLTHMCRDFCGYCIFRKTPEQAGDTLYMTPEQVLDVVKAGANGWVAPRPCSLSANARSNAIPKRRNGLPSADSGRRWNTWPTSTVWWWRKPPFSPTPTPAP